MEHPIFVTGALGWLGFNLIEALLHGLPDGGFWQGIPSQEPLRCLILPGQDPSPLKAFGDRVEVIAGDLRHPEDCAAFCRGGTAGTLFHTAGIIHPRRVRDFYDINLEGTKNLLDAAIAAGMRRAVVVSSNSPCGCNPHADHRFDEQSPYNPYMHYGRSKMLMELAVKERQSPENNVDGKIETVLIRAPWFYGRHQPPRQTLFFRMIRDGKAPIVGSGNNLRSMVYIDNLCQGAILAAITARANGQIYWIADAQPYTMNAIVDTVERLLESEFGQHCAHRRLRLPGIVSELALIADAAIQSLGGYHQKIHVLSEMNKVIACSIAKARNELGYNPAVDLEEGMRRSLQWLQASSKGNLEIQSFLS